MTAAKVRNYKGTQTDKKTELYLKVYMIVKGSHTSDIKHL
jgi:hypothetical protein